MAVAVGDPVILARAPGFVVASSSVTADSATFTTSETQIATVTASLIDGVIYLVQFNGNLDSSVADDVALVHVHEDNLSGTERMTARLQLPSISGAGTKIIMQFLYTAAATASKTFIASAERAAGTGNLRLEAASNRPAIMTVTVAS